MTGKMGRTRRKLFMFDDSTLSLYPGESLVIDKGESPVLTFL